MKKFLCYYLEDNKMCDTYSFAKSEKNARDKMRRRGITCKAIVEVESIDINLDNLRNILKEHYSETMVDFICESVKAYVR